MSKAVTKKSKFHTFIYKRRIISLMHSSIVRRIWLNFMVQYLGFRLFYTFHDFFFRISDFSSMSTTDETSLVEMHIWCIKIGIALYLHNRILQFRV
jgi:hypothetical protein